MSFALSAVALLAIYLGFANGSNDVSKGIATLVGSGVSSYRRAVAWGTVWTVAGGLLAAFASQSLVATFSGKGFLARPEGSTAFLASVTIGATAWVLFASKTGLPVSTTHAITGALAGAAIVGQGVSALHWAYFARKTVLPLGVSPLVSIALIYALFPLMRRSLASVDAYCVCLERRVAVLPAGAASMSVVLAEGPVVALEEDCGLSPAVTSRLNVLDGLHWFSSAATSFARGLNDTPKIVALGIVASAALGTSAFPFYATVAVAMGVGSVIGGLRVTETLASRLTRMSAAEGFSANLVTTLLVGAASFAGLPVSTTHVSSSAIVGIGLHRDARTVNWKTVREILLAWIVTLPVAALVGAGAYWLLGGIR